MDIQKTYWNNSESSMALAFPIAKINKEKRTVSGFASLDNLDRHGDIVTSEANRSAFENFRGNIREMHQPIAVGKMLNFKEDSFFDKETGKKYTGIYVTTYVSKGAQDTWEKILDGTYTGFSIGGNIVDAKMEKSDDGSDSRRVIHKYDLHELSFVDSPANQLANIFSIEKNIDGQNIVKGMISDVETENVFWCQEDEVASTSSEISKNCVVCGDAMTNIGWVESSDTEKFESIEKVIDSYFKKDDAPTSAHEATETAAPGLAGPKVIDTTTAINLYPDQNKNKKKVTKSEDTISLSKGGNKMEEDTNTEIEKSVDVESAAEEVAVINEAPEGEAIEKSVEISEVEDTLDFEKMVNDFKTFVGESLVKNHSDSSAAYAEITKMFEETSTKVEKQISDLSEKYEALNKNITDMYSKIDYIDHRFAGFESASAVKKSSDLSGPMEDLTIQKSIWQGHFLGVNSLTK